MRATGSRWRRRLVIGLAIIVVLLVVVAGGFYAAMKYSVQPLLDGNTLADGAVTIVVTDHVGLPGLAWGPIPVGAYLFTLEGGGVGLVDAGLDSGAVAIHAALAATGRSTADVRAILFTHEHGDHMAGAKAFGDARIYVPEAYAARIAKIRAGIASAQAPLDRFPYWSLASGQALVEGYRAGERLDVFGTPVEMFALPGHTPTSVAILVHGVLFLGDSAASLYDGRVHPNTLLGTDPDQNVRSLRALAEHLRPRRNEIRHVAFGHQGPVDRLDALLDWAATSPKD